MGVGIPQRWGLSIFPHAMGPRRQIRTVTARAIGLGFIALLAVSGGRAGAGALSTPSLAACPIFPRDNLWNQRIDKLAVARNSAAIIRSIGLVERLHPAFGSGTYAGGPIGIPYNVASKKTRRVRVRFKYAGESDPGPYPIPRDV